MSGHHLPKAGLDRLPKASLNRESFRKTLELLPYMKLSGRQFMLGFCCLLAASNLAFCFPLLSGGLIDAALRPGGAKLPGFGILSLNQVALTLACTITLQAVATFEMILIFNRMGQSALANLRRETYGRIIDLPMAFFAQRRVGELASRVSLDISQIESALVFALPQMCRQAIILIGSVVLIALTSVKLTLAMLCTVPLLIAAAVIFGRKTRRLSRETQDRLAETGTIVEETLQAIASVKAFANEAFELNRYQKTNASVFAAAFRTAKWKAGFNAFALTAFSGGLVIVLWFGARLLQSGQMTAGELTRFVLYTVFVAGAMGQATELFSQIQRASGASQRVCELLKERSEHAVETTARPTPGTTPLPTRLRGAVEFAGLSFRYPSRPEVAVLTDISLSVQPGEVIALVGRSGAGKSTLIALLLRFYEQAHGRLLIDGRDSRDYPLKWLRGQMALVPQDILLFGGTIAENIAYGRPGASEAEIRQAAKQANADEFIQVFPEGYATLVGDRGIKLSGGQRQRIARFALLLAAPPATLWHLRGGAWPR